MIWDRSLRSHGTLFGNQLLREGYPKVFLLRLDCLLPRKHRNQNEDRPFLEEGRSLDQGMTRRTRQIME